MDKPAKYERTPQPVTAMKVTKDNVEDVVRWILDAGGDVIVTHYNAETYPFRCLGHMGTFQFVAYGQYVLNPEGTTVFYPSRADVFEEQYTMA